MQFTDDDIRKYQDLCRTYFNEEIDEKTAIEELNNLVLMVSLIYRPLPDATQPDKGLNPEQPAACGKSKPK